MKKAALVVLLMFGCGAPTATSSDVFELADGSCAEFVELNKGCDHGNVIVPMKVDCPLAERAGYSGRTEPRNPFGISK